MSKFSVRKPLTVFVVVIAIIALGVVSLLKMTPDLLPSIDLPYMVVMTTYPGATPEEVQDEVTKPLEQTLATIENIKNINSISNANYSLIIMEFENGSNMDTAMVSTLQNVDLIEGAWSDTVGDPYIMKINPSMLPISVAAVDMEGYDTEKLSNFVNDTLMNKLEGVTGVASIQTGGLLESQINVKISEKKIEKLNGKLIAKINSGMSEGMEKINDGLDQVNDGISQVNDGLNQINNAEADLDQKRLETEQAYNAGMLGDEEYAGAVAQINAGKEQIIEQKLTLEGTKEELKDTKAELKDAKENLKSEWAKAIDKADIGPMITMDMVSGILTAQNFDMPAGYIQSNGVQYMVSVGDKIKDLKEAKNLYLFNIEGIGDVYLNDVADCFVSDNSDKIYASIDGQPGVLLTFSKQSNYPTAQVSNKIQDKFTQLEEEYEGLKFTSLMDQGDYIYLIIQSILESLIYGAIFAVIILFLFLRNLKPTFITLLAIPISLTAAIVLMYFSGVTINLISLSGLAVSVGMLVDNSIVVIENIFRLRREGIDAKRAAVAGAKEVGGAITASTLTTVCVFAPIIFVQGITRQLFSDMALTVTYSLMASLVIALTLVPAMASRMLKKAPKPEGRGMVGFREGYKRLLNWNLNHKALILLIAVFLLVYTVYGSLSKGLIFIPDMSTPQMTGSLTMNDEDATVEETAEVSNEVLERLAKIEGVETVGGMLDSSSEYGSFMGETDSNTVALYVIIDPEVDKSGGDIEKEAEDACKGLPCEVDIISSSSVSEYTSALGGEGVSISVFSSDNDKLQKAAKRIGKELEKVEGISEVDNGLVDANTEYHFTVDKNKAMKKGVTVAQVYMAVSEGIKYNNKATTMNLKGEEVDVVVAIGDEETVTLKDLKNREVADGVKVKDVATLEKTKSLPSILRVNQKTSLTVTGLIEEGYNVTLVTEDAKEALNGIEIPAGTSYEFDGENEMIMDAMIDLLEMMALGILLVYLIMVAQFQSLKSPFIVLFTIPLAFTGGLGALLVFGKEISIMAMIGLIILNGVIVNNGIVLVDYINQLRARGHNKRAAIILGASTRIRPVLMTSLTTILGLIILAMGKTAGTDMMQPIALVCIGGLVYATLLTLLVVPVIYDIFNGEKYKITKKDDLDISGIIVE